MNYKGTVMKINGLPVVNAKKSIVLHIKKNDIERGKIKKPGACAAAIACERQLGCTEARVHVGRTYVRYNGKWERFLTSQALRAEIVAFDRGGKFEPGDYRLIKMQPSRLGDKTRDKRRVRTGKRRSKYHTLSGVRPIASVE